MIVSHMIMTIIISDDNNCYYHLTWKHLILSSLLMSSQRMLSEMMKCRTLADDAVIFSDNMEDDNEMITKIISKMYFFKNQTTIYTIESKYRNLKYLYYRNNFWYCLWHINYHRKLDTNMAHRTAYIESLWNRAIILPQWNQFWNQ
jgi:hypothetical protein